MVLTTIVSPYSGMIMFPRNRQWYLLTLKAAASAPTGRDHIVEILTILISNEQL